MIDEGELRGVQLYDALMAIKPVGLAETDWAEKAGINRGFFTNLKGKATSPRADTLRKLLRHIGKTEGDLHSPPSASRAVVARADDDVQIVEIQHIDRDWGLGAAFTDTPVVIDQLPFPKVWIETITSSPPAMLAWARGRGDSMLPTIDDGDLVLLDRSQRRVTEQDALWAFTVGDTASIKRLRVKGDRFVILSDNASVPPDEEPIDFVNIVARVVFVGKRK